MGKKDEGTVRPAYDPDMILEHKGKNLINLIVYGILFTGYSLTFLVPKFYGATDRYVGIFVFFACIVLFFNNLDLIRLIKGKNREFIFILILLLITGINLLIVRSGLGAFFVAADFILIFYLSGYISFNRKYLMILSGMYVLLLLYWFVFAYDRLFADIAYFGYNTNTGATFTIYTLLCAFLFLVILKEKYEIAGLFMTVLMVKGFQLALWHRARGAFVMLIMFTLLYFIVPKKLWAKNGFYKFIWIFATAGSLVFVAFYIILGTTGINFNIPFFYKSLFSGRELIWREFFELFVKKPLTGIGTNVTIESFFEFNVHNAMYNFLVIDGIIVFAGILVLIYERAALYKRSVSLSRVSMCAFCILMAVFIESFFDVDLIWADYALNLLYLVTMINSGSALDGKV
ncbi:MAG: hypothetical protein K6B28_12230 [Lachnospiraceae bacterium]|nr:hypothetical protein [Lachnospiraceae bacterium]